MTLSPIVADAWRMASWGWDVPARVRWIEQCVALGVTSFDHADIYGGRVRPSHRIKSYDSARAHVTASVENSLRALHTDRVDLLLLHRPDALMDPDELADTFHALRAAGKVREFGVSNHAPSQFAMLHRRLALATHQIELSPLHLDALGDGTLDQCMDLRVRPMIRSPLAGGQLFTAGDERALRVRAVLDALGQAHGVGAATVAYAWILRHPLRPLPITGSSAHRGHRRGRGGAGAAPGRRGVVPRVERQHRARGGLRAAPRRALRRPLPAPGRPATAGARRCRR